MVDSDGKTHLDKSYCAPQKECFGGIVGAKSPYVDDMGAIGKSTSAAQMLHGADCVQQPSLSMSEHASHYFCLSC